MRVTCKQIGKHFNYQWVFRDLDYSFQPGQTYAVLGPNGSGKTTLLRILSGQLLPSEGKVVYQYGSTVIEPEQAYRHLGYAAPYLDLIDAFTLREIIQFHFKLKPPLKGIDTQNCIELLELQPAANKLLKNFSSGMMQRLKLGLALFSNVPVLLLDEPMTNLDKTGRKWYLQLLEKYLNDRMLIVSSNRAEEHEYCEQSLFVPDFKP